MMVLRGKRMAEDGNDLPAAHLTSVYARVWGCRARRMRRVERGGIDIRDHACVFVLGHGYVI